jgi:hypothetical protein
MPSTVNSLLEAAGLALSGRVSWNQQVRDDSPGVYIVSIVSLELLPTASVKQSSAVPPIDTLAVSNWISRVPTLQMDGVRPSSGSLVQRLSEFWLADETILYIGKAGTSIKKRVGQYYRTPLGDRGPHAGGHWLKTLSVLSKLSIFWTTTNKPEIMEDLLLASFMEKVSAESRSKLRDPNLPLPFANMEVPGGRSKAHGISGSVKRE